MKKSRIIVPALAMIAFSTAASIVGSVAWFTASRTFNMTAGSFSVVKTSANLECEVTAGIGTYLDPADTDNKTITLTHNIGTEQDPNNVSNVLTDGSFSHLSGNIYQPDEAGTNFHETYPEVAYNDDSAEAKLTRGTTTDGGTILSAVSFNLTFKVKFGSAAGNYGLFVDNSAANKTSFSCADSTLYTAKGFRMAFYPTSAGGKASVLAKFQDNGTWDHDGDGASVDPAPTAEIEKLRYVNAHASQSDLGGVAYGSSSQYLIDSGYTALPASALPAENTSETTVSTRPDYLGKFTFSANAEVTLSYAVVCWFDGNDPEIRNRAQDSQYQTVTSALHFEAIKIGPAE